MKSRLVAWSFLLMLGSLLVCRAVAFDFDYWVNRVGWAQTDGRLVLWMDNGWKIPLAATDVPMRFQFCYESAQAEVKDGALGAGWWVPLLESHIELATTTGKIKKYYRFTEFGGRYRFVDEVKEQPGHYRSESRLWEADEQEGGVVAMKGPENWRMTYKDGMIQSAVSPGGMSLTWKRNEQGRVTAVQSPDGPLLEAGYDEMGHIKELTLRDGTKFRFESASHPRVVVKDKKLEPAADVSSVQSITVSDGTTAQFKVFTTHPGMFEMDFAYRKPGHSFVKDHLKWDAVSGHLVEDKNAHYSVIRHPKGGAFPEVRRIVADGRYDSYWHDTVHNVTHTTDIDGTKWENHGAKAPIGVSYRLEKSIETDWDGRKVWTFLEYRGNGTLKLKTVFPGGRAPEETHYDEKGKPIREAPP